MKLFKRLAQAFTVSFFMILLGCSSEKNSALVTAAGDGNIARVEELLQQGANANYKLFDSGITPLIAAASAGYIDVAEILLNSGADINLKDDSVGAALYWAAFNGKVEMFDYLSGVNGRLMCNKEAAEYLLKNIRKKKYITLERRILEKLRLEDIDLGEPQLIEQSQK